MKSGLWRVGGGIGVCDMGVHDGAVGFGSVWAYVGVFVIGWAGLRPVPTLQPLLFPDVALAGMGLGLRLGEERRVTFGSGCLNELLSQGFKHKDFGS